MKIVNLSIYGTDMVDVLPIQINKEKIMLIRRDHFINNENYLEYSTQKNLLLPIMVHQDENKGIIKVIKSGLSENFLYHAILEENYVDYDIIGLYKLSSEKNISQKIVDFKIYKCIGYKNFNDFTSSFASIEELQDNKVFIRVNTNKNIIYYYKDLDNLFLKEINLECIKEDLRYFGTVQDEKGIYYVFRTSDPSTLDNRKFYVHLLGIQNANRVRDKIIVIKKEDLESSRTLTKDNFILIDKADLNEGIGNSWVANNRIYYIKEDITEDKVEHYVFDFEKKVRAMITDKTVGKVPAVNKNKVYYYTHEQDELKVFDEKGNIIAKLSISSFYERVEKFFSNYVIIGSVTDPYVKKIYDLNNEKCVGEYCGKVFEYFNDEDTLVIC